MIKFTTTSWVVAIGAVLIYLSMLLSFLGVAVWLVATIIKGVFF